VRLNVLLRRVLRMLGGMDRVTVRQMRVVCGFFVVAFGVCRSGFVMVARSVFVMLRCLGVMLGCFVRHLKTSRLLENRASSAQRDYREPALWLGLMAGEFRMNIRA